MAVDKKLLGRLRVLYVEDDENIRRELSTLLSNFFGKVYVADDGLKGLEAFKTYQNDIDIILSDINMPGLTGIEMMKKIREIDSKIPVIFATAYSDNEFLAEAIKIKVYDYIVKPIDIRNLLSVMNELANVLYQEAMIEQQNKELENYKNVIDSNNIVIKADKEGKITYVNEHFCDLTGFDSSELLGKDLIYLKHEDTDKKIYDEIFNCINNNKPYHGKLKQITKTDKPIVVDVYIIPILDDSGDIIGSISVERNITDEINHKRELQIALMKDKGEIFLKGKESIAELNGIIKELNHRTSELQRLLKESEVEKDRIILATEKHKVENKRMKMDLKQLRQNSDYVDDKKAMTLKMNKENMDLKQEIKKLKLALVKVQENAEKTFNQEKISYEIKIDDLEKEISDLKSKSSTENDNKSFEEKLNYWKQKAKDEAGRAEKLEREIMQHGDKNILKKLFGGKI